MLNPQYAIDASFGSKTSANLPLSNSTSYQGVTVVYTGSVLFSQGSLIVTPNSRGLFSNPRTAKTMSGFDVYSVWVIYHSPFSSFVYTSIIRLFLSSFLMETPIPPNVTYMSIESYAFK